jgi:succinate-semialdehyde dehydrogenase / glutarate-semialdehyde dehydrogenase
MSEAVQHVETETRNAFHIGSAREIGYSAPPLFISGVWRKGGATTSSPVVNPATGETIARLSHASAVDLDEALEAARLAFISWRGTKASRRAEIVVDASRLMRTRADEIAPLLTLEQGKPLSQAKAEILVAAEMVHWYGEQARRIYGRLVPSSLEGGELSVRHEPVGPCALFSPWNMPVLLASRKIGGALAAGCSAILKPAEETPAAIAEVVRCFVDAGLPPGVLNLVFGVPKDISRHLLASSVVRKVSLTGSVGVGRDIARLASSSFKRTTLELGGYAPVLVLPDADIDRAVELLVGAKFRNAGQLCLAPTRFLVHQAVYERFIASFAERSRKLRLGNGLKDAVDMGPLANARRRDAIASLVDDALGRGARTLVGGAAMEGQGFFYQPTVLVDVPGDARIRTEEPFGPVAIIDSFADLDTAIESANGTDYGLAGYAFTDSASAQRKIIEGLQVGVVAFNNIAVSMAEVPFGGVKDSGYGRESGEEGLSEYLTVKTVHLA